MPVVNNTSSSSSSLVDRLRDIKKRIDIRPSLQNVSRRWHNVYDSLAVGSPFRVQEFYKYIKVYKQCPENDLLFMNMTVQLARASLFPTSSMFKQMLKFERHLNELLIAEQHYDVFGSRGIEILANHNAAFMRLYQRYKRRTEVKKNQQHLKKVRKDAKMLAAMRDARMKVRTAELLQRKPLKPVVVAASFGDLSPSAKDATVAEVIPAAAAAIVEVEEEEVKTSQEAEEQADDVAAKLNEVVEQLIQATSAVKVHEGENVVVEEEEEKEEVDDDDSCSTCSEDEDEEEEEEEDAKDEEEEELHESEEDEDLEKIEEKDVDALEYEML